MAPALVFCGDDVSIALLLKLFIAVLGLTLPGYALARALRLTSSLAAAFPLSALLICQLVVLLACLDAKIGFVPVAAALALLTTLFALVAGRGENPAPSESVPAGEDDDRERPLLVGSMLTALALLGAVAFRTTIYPLGGFDTFIRWDGLAREILQYGSLSFYPPVSGADFSIYPMPDGIPPLVASVYWWIYGATGSTLPQWTALAVVLQLASLLGLVWSASRTAFGKKAAAFSLLAVIASPLLIRSIMIGQESGFLTLAVAGQFCFALAATRKPALRPVIGAALFAALGALSREYGPALALPGFFILTCAPTTRRLAWPYALAAVLAFSPWYIRNWLLTGTPLYPTALPGLPPPNPLLATLMSYYGEIFGIAHFGAKEWLEIGSELILGGSVALLAGLSCLAAHGRRLLPSTLSLLLIATLWLWSIGKTSGGVIYSMRVLAPGIAILAVAAGKALAEKGWLQHGVWLLIPALPWSLFSALSFPGPPARLATAILSTKGEAPEFCAANREFAAMISALEIPTSGILTDSPFLAVILKRETRFRPVMIWSSEVSQLLNANGDPRETEKSLLQRDIRFVAMNRASIHNGMLGRLALYREGSGRWKILVAQGDWALFAIPTEAGR